MGLATIMMIYLGLLYGVPRRHPSVKQFPGTDFSFVAASPLFAIFGVAALLALIAGASFLLVAVGTLVLGKRVDNPALVMPPLISGGSDDKPIHQYSMQGTFTLTLIFLGVFALIYIVNWYLLGRLWIIG